MNRSAAVSSSLIVATVLTVAATFGVIFAQTSASAAEPAPSVLVVPASGHVTGLPYPARCAMRHSANGRWLPDPGCTPGAASSAVDQGNIRTTICTTGYTATVRAPESETARVKTAAMHSYNQATPGRTTTELDHQVPLELGGSNDIKNLWPEPSDISNGGYRNTKDSVERALNRAVCAAHPRVTLVQAQNAINDDWTTALQSLHLK